MADLNPNLPGDDRWAREALTQLAKEALVSNRGVYELVLEKGLLTKEQLDMILAPENMIKPRKMKL